MSELAGSLTPQQLETQVPACPAWSIRDLVAHHTGVVGDTVSGAGFPELGDPLRLLQQWRDPQVARDRDAMTARQVEERRDRPFAQVLEEWRSSTEQLVPMLRGEEPFPPGVSPLVAALVINDIVVHEGDLHQALSLDPAPETLAVSLALAGYAASLDFRLREVTLPALALAYGGKEKRLGEGDPAATVSSDRHTLVRMLAARLTADEIRALDWSGDPEPYLEILPEYGPVTHKPM
jgi:uncharacterized protein (TIGR03083 family)